MDAIDKTGKSRFCLTQTGLIQKVLTIAYMIDFNSVSTLDYTTSLILDTGGVSSNELWKYSTVMGMLVYLAINYRPDIALAVHQCAHFTHATRQSHYNAVKQILH